MDAKNSLKLGGLRKKLREGLLKEKKLLCKKKLKEKNVFEKI